MDKELFREIIKFAVEKAREITNKQQALELKYLYKEFDKQIGKILSVGEYVQYGDKLYEVIQEHTAQEDWTPNVASSLFVVIDKEHSGAIDDPIPAQTNMIYYNGKYYIEGETLYLCIRDSGIALHFLPSELVGNYFKIATEEEEIIPPVEEEIIPPIEEEIIPPVEDVGESYNNPIIVTNPFEGVSYEVGKYYMNDNVVYKCIREGLLYHAPSALVGNYFEIVTSE